MQGGMQYCRTLYPLLPYTPLLGGLAAGLLPHTHRSKITLLGGLAAGLRPLSSPYEVEPPTERNVLYISIPNIPPSIRRGEPKAVRPSVRPRRAWSKSANERMTRNRYKAKKMPK